MFRYPNGKTYNPSTAPPKQRQPKETYSNRGMTLEEDLNETNQYYLDRGIAVIHKKPTPVQIVNVDFPKRSAAVIREAYFKQSSTTDYNGVYKGKYIDFEAKETQSSTSFPLQNFHEHQVRHMKMVLDQGGLSFVILSAFQSFYLMEAAILLEFWERKENGGRKSITKKEIELTSHPIPLGYQPRIDYIKVLEKLYFLSS
ncbi:Holliday junction resolvase RecU [Metabacillus idriensis]|uniref:Holliday junction resolvase RecU n=1 Tax=Metabacillus idriensis TaxID=324768 RepID=UPI002814418A|nr:Holliday junction resolvase RecU [Metabacillus idriensis]MDR0139757.1 Holliday junction resolvase RecU [Metabacillus idriensis]